ncbi:hypothetical protein EV210_11011 [Anaerospora hongkongensis]|jgi:hypothetical protein|uniref:Uncharacterized protein n=1 Tax=Anaerospora hongkongensis TaxID=244830 RepID=A0A4R1PXA4_9FIRM|nr:hypothetical protein [Anaerospora hongkongensis]TCL35771.1 hypothetical protein EV210_11011 [Anaerospora hongkongensis]
MDEKLKEKLDEVGSKIDDKVEEKAIEYDIPKWAVWLGGAIAVSVIIKILF